MSQALRVVTYNIHHGADYQDTPSLDSITAVLADLDADIIALQEVDMNLPRSGRQKQAAELARRLNMGYVFGAAMHYGIGSYGNAVLSRLSIAGYNTIPLPDPQEDRCCLQVNIQVGQDVLGFFAVHLGLNHQLRMQHLEQQVLPAVLRFPGAVILAGDFNATSSQPEIELITHYLTDSFHYNSGNLLNTFSSHKPMARIDYIFTNSSLQIKRSYITSSDASDHFPVTAEMILNH